MIPTLVWTIILALVSLQFFLKEVTSFALDISSEDPWLRQFFVEQTESRKTWDNGEHIFDSDFGHFSVGATNRYKLGKDVRFLLYTRKNANGPPFRIYKGCKKRLRASGFNPEHPTKILLHGFGGGADALINSGVYSAYLEKGDYNVICVDWGSLCKIPWYGEARENVPKVGKYVGKMVDFLIRIGKADPMDIHLIGHSLGAHVAGYAGSYLGFLRLGRITGLDPAGILYDSDSDDERLNSHSALQVDVIHTSAGELGFKTPLGDIDFYPNGGVSQPGCDDLLELCNHNKAVEYFINSIRNADAYQAVKCHSLQDAISKNCYNNERGTMGETIGDMSPGIYYVNTY